MKILRTCSTEFKVDFMKNKCIRFPDGYLRITLYRSLFEDRQNFIGSCTQHCQNAAHLKQLKANDIDRSG